MMQASHRFLPPSSHSEHVDDLPLLLGFLQRLQLPRLIDSTFLQTFDCPSKNLGMLSTLWLSHMLSQSQRQSRHLRSWIMAHPETLRRHAPTFTQISNANDAHLREILSILANDIYWEKVESAFNSHIMPMYNVQATHIRMETHTSLWYVNSDGSLQIDNERRWRSGAVCVRMVSAFLEPANILLTMSFSLGNEHKQDLALEVIRRTRACLTEPLTYLGNSALSSNVRAAIIRNKDHYLALLSQAETNRDLAELLACPTMIQPIFPRFDQHHTPIAEGCERHVQLHSADPREAGLEERQIYVRRHDCVEQQEHALRERVQMVCDEIMELTQPKRGKRRLLSLEALQKAAQEICAMYDVEGLIDISYTEDTDARTIRRYRGRPTTTRVNHMLGISARLNEEAFAQRKKALGWHIYVTTLGAQTITFTDLLESSITQSTFMERLNNRQVSILPGVMQRTEHMRGLVRLMSLALRCLSLLDYVSKSKSPLSEPEIMDWQGEEILRTFLNLTLTTVFEGLQEHRHLTALSTGQRRMLDLLGLPYSLYQL